MRWLELPFTGPATFFKAPHRPLSQSWQADVGFLGIPYDFAVGYRPGARFAPAALREASGRYAPGPDGYFDWESQSYRMVGVELVDAGDVDPAQLEYLESFARITAAAQELRQRVKLPVFVGGDHSVSFPLLQAFDNVPKLGVLQLDAHLDFSDSRNSTRYANSSPFRRATEHRPSLQRWVVGLRGLRSNPEAFASARALGHTLISARQVQQQLNQVLAQLPQGQKLYISLDVDVLDPSIVPGTSSPEVEGISYAQTLAILAHAFKHNQVLGLDLVELAPNLDPSGLSALVAARLLAEAMSLAV